MKIGSLFSGIGGLELGLEMAGLGHVVWQCEINPFCRSVLAKHWPNVTRYTDVKSLRGVEPVDILCGGFPCQDVSSAGKKKGLSGEKSGLWFEYLRIVDELRPRFVIVENVTSGKKLWLPTVRRGLHSLGYGTRAFAISAADVGAPHLRRRVFVVADSERAELREQPGRGCWPRGEGSPARDTDRDSEPAVAEHDEVGGLRDVAGGASAWSAPPDLRRVADGVPRRVDRIRALGNAVVPQCAEVIGRIVVDIVNGCATV